MTVSSLWKVLDEAQCGRAVGLEEILDPSGESSRRDLKTINPWNYNNTHQSKRDKLKKKKPVTLAVDLSIWICESLTSPAMAENHLSPALHLVFTRTLKLLSSGMKLIVVVEGKRRIRTDSTSDDHFHKRRSGTAFWKACRDCKTMLELLGVPVVQAKAEGEALCALLNQKGIVDGVISNDGDCLLFGAKVLYTKFSLENLEHSKVIRYDLDKLKAKLQLDSTEEDQVATSEIGIMTLSRSDLIAFALLTGSDLVGPGLPKVGHYKTIRFIRKCQVDNPLHVGTAAITELKTWEQTLPQLDHTCLQDAPGETNNDMSSKNEDPKAQSKTCCSRCCHPGDKRSHLKHGCEVCGTKPGEPCLEFTAEDRFRKTIRAKALAMVPPFEPSKIMGLYTEPNDNQVPAKLVGTTSENLAMSTPNLAKLMEMKLIVKGRSYESSREYLKLKTGQLLARLEILGSLAKTKDEDIEKDGGLNTKSNEKFSRNRPQPIEILKSSTRDKIEVYEIKWRVNATMTDDDGNGIDGYEYSSFESQDLVRSSFPHLVSKFQKAEQERQKQGDREKDRRKEFLQSLFVDVSDTAKMEEENCPKSPSGRKGPSAKQRATFFQKAKADRTRETLRPQKSGQHGGEAKLLFTLGRLRIVRNQKHGRDPQAKNETPHNDLPTPSSSIETKSRDPFLKRKKKKGKRSLFKVWHGNRGAERDSVPTSIKIPVVRCSPIQSPPKAKRRFKSPTSKLPNRAHQCANNDQALSPLNSCSQDETVCHMGGFRIQMTPCQTSRRKLNFDNFLLE